MHQSSIENMQKCYERYVKTHAWPGRSAIDVIDVGGANVNGSYADIFSGGEFVYRAADINADANVDIVLEDPYKLPFDDGSIDMVISGQAFEHVEFFWLLFEEMARALKPDGLIILIAPSSGPIHKYPVDCYRFYPDAYRALAKYTDCALLDVIHDQRGPWKDLVGVFTKNGGAEQIGKSKTREWQINRYEAEIMPVSINVRHPEPGVEVLQGEVKYLEVLERLHKELSPELYLEIGVRVGNSLSLAKANSIAVDPAPEINHELAGKHQLYIKSSDDFFEFDSNAALEGRGIDLAFIDGMHLFEFALRDFINVEKRSTPSTVVVIDDVSPNHEIQSHRERHSQVWTGDIWKLAKCLEKYRKDLQLTYLNTYPSGLLLITGLKPGNNLLTERYNPIVREYKYKDLDGETRDEVISRSNSIQPFETNYWEWLTGFVDTVKKASPDRKLQVAAEQHRLLKNRK